MNFLIADLIKFVSGIAIAFSQGDATKIKSGQFSEFGSGTICILNLGFITDATAEILCLQDPYVKLKHCYIS